MLTRVEIKNVTTESGLYLASEVDELLARLDAAFGEIVTIMSFYMPPQSRSAAKEKASILWKQAKEGGE